MGIQTRKIRETQPWEDLREEHCRSHSPPGPVQEHWEETESRTNCGAAVVVAMTPGRIGYRTVL